MASSNTTTETSPRIIQWILDTRPLWQVSKQASSRDEVAALKTTASKALSFLPSSEQASVLKYYHLKDAKMALASHLLKHLIISKYCHVPWSQSHVSRAANGKPCFVPDAESADHVEFNVSHQAGIVSLIAVVGTRGGVSVGTDVVCWNERLEHDHRHIEKEGFFDWVDIHAEVFAESEVSFMKLGELTWEDIGFGGLVEMKGYTKDNLSRCQWRNQKVELDVGGQNMGFMSNTVIDVKLRRFYAMWCLREAYVKMTGEALLAPWLKELEISGVKVPRAKKGNSELVEGDVVKDFRIHFKEKLVKNVKMELSALGEGYMIAGAVRVDTGVDGTGLEMSKWEKLDLETDILAFGEEFS